MRKENAYKERICPIDTLCVPHLRGGDRTGILIQPCARARGAALPHLKAAVPLAWTGVHCAFLYVAKQGSAMWHFWGALGLRPAPRTIPARERAVSGPRVAVAALQSESTGSVGPCKQHS